MTNYQCDKRNYILFCRHGDIPSYCLWRESDMLNDSDSETYNWWNDNYNSYKTEKKNWVHPNGYQRNLSEEIVIPEDIMRFWTSNKFKP